MQRFTDAVQDLELLIVSLCRSVQRPILERHAELVPHGQGQAQLVLLEGFGSAGSYKEYPK